MLNSNIREKFQFTLYFARQTRNYYPKNFNRLFRNMYWKFNILLWRLWIRKETFFDHPNKYFTHNKQINNQDICEFSISLLKSCFLSITNSKNTCKYDNFKQTINAFTYISTLVLINTLIFQDRVSILA